MAETHCLPAWPRRRKVWSFQPPVCICQVVVFNVDDRPVPIVHRIIRVHEKGDRSIDVLTKVQPSPDGCVPLRSTLQLCRTLCCCRLNAVQNLSAPRVCHQWLASQATWFMEAG